LPPDVRFKATDSLAVFKGPISKEMEGKEREGEERGCYCG